MKVVFARKPDLRILFLRVLFTFFRRKEVSCYENKILSSLSISLLASSTHTLMDVDVRKFNALFNRSQGKNESGKHNSAGGINPNLRDSLLRQSIIFIRFILSVLYTGVVKWSP